MSTKVSRQDKLATLAEAWGMDLEDLLQEAMFDSVCAGICMNADCDYTTDVEPDCRDGYCEFCGTQTVKSALVLAGVI